MMADMGLPFGQMWPLSALSFLALLVFFLYVKQFMGTVEPPSEAVD